MRLHLDSSTVSSAVTSADSGRVAPVPSSTASPDVREADRAEPNTDSIGISGTSTALGRIAEARAQRIKQLTGAVRTGTYSVSGAVVARAILSQAFTE